MYRRGQGRISQFKRASVTTGKHFSIRRHQPHPRRSRSGFDVVMSEIRRGRKRARVLDPFENIPPPHRNLRGPAGRAVPSGVAQAAYRALQNMARAGQDIVGEIADRARPYAERLAGNAVRTALQGAVGGLMGPVGYVVARRYQRANALPAARY